MNCLFSGRMFLSQTDLLPRTAKSTLRSVMVLEMMASLAQWGAIYCFFRGITGSSNQNHFCAVFVLQQKQWENLQRVIAPRKLSKNILSGCLWTRWTARHLEGFWCDWRVWRGCISNASWCFAKSRCWSCEGRHQRVTDYQLKNRGQNHHCNVCLTQNET